ncbi:collagenase [Nonomuraea lactucae]|uniref:collagenase n=1 Tax=Nonomuraea lactucae TaxID=2249762 RepID=UPI0019635C5E|nr:collagenase [Nonomuraea lactucae]
MLLATALYAAPAAASSADPPPAPSSTRTLTRVDGHGTTPIKDRPPLPEPADPDPAKARAQAQAAACDLSVFTNNTGAALVNAIKSAEIPCVSEVFNLRGSAARAALRESQMVTVANALRANAQAYPGDNSQRTEQLVYYLRAGYYVEFYHEAEVGAYGPTLAAATRGALDAFFANGHSSDTSEAHGRILMEVVTLIDSAEENIRYLYVVKRLLDNYRPSYGYNMQWAVNAAFTVTWRGHFVAGFGAAAQSAGTPTTIYDFVVRNFDQLNTDYSTIISNAGVELARFLQYVDQRPAVRPRVKDLLSRSSITGWTAKLWVRTAESANSYDKDNCSYYGTCNLSQRLMDAVLKVRHTCSASLKIVAQELTSSQLAATCSSLANQDAYFHNVVKDNGPVANDHNTTLEVVVFDSRNDYRTYAGAMFGIDTNNGGMYLEGDPSVTGNIPRFIAHEADWLRPAFEIWNLNHEYTHYLDGRYDLYGDFTAGDQTPLVWWSEGVAEYVSYHYRGVPNTDALAEAPKRTYTLSTLFDTTYANSNTTRTYEWGYLAARYMIERRWSDTSRILGYYRVGDWNGARAYIQALNLNADFSNWLGTLGDVANQPPTPAFTYTTSGLTATFTDTSRDSDGTITSRSWDFGDGTTSTTTNPTKTYTSAGTYTVKLTVRDDDGATASTTRSVTVTTGGGLPTCADSDTRALGQNCRRAGISATQGDMASFFIYLPPGTTSLTIRSSGGTGDADLYFHSSEWATNTKYTRSSTADGNAETLTVTGTQLRQGDYNYVTLYGYTAFTGVTISTQY